MTSVNSPVRALPRDLLVIIGLELALIVALHLVGTAQSTVPIRSLGTWLADSDPTVVVVALARLAGLLLGYWLLTSTLAYAAAHLLGWESVTGILRWVTLPVVRRVVHGVTAISLTSASLVGPAAFSVSPALAESVESTDDDSTTDGADDEAADDEPIDAAGWPSPGGDGEFWRPDAITTPVSTAEDADDAESTHTVVEGEHLWSIAESHLRGVTGRAVTEDEICEYWVRVMDVNRDSLRSGDPDLIYPSERITLPPVFAD